MKHEKNKETYYGAAGAATAVTDILLCILTLTKYGKCVREIKRQHIDAIRIKHISPF